MIHFVLKKNHPGISDEKKETQAKIWQKQVKIVMELLGIVEPVAQHPQILMKTV